MKPLDIFITYVSWENDGKIRPVLVFIINENDIDIYQITTQYNNKSETIRGQYFKIDDWTQAGLDRQSYIDTGTLITLPLSTFKNQKSIGHLTESDKIRFLNFLNL